MTLSIIILSYNTKDLLAQTLSSIPRNPTWEIIVVDNASTDGSLEMVLKKYTYVKTIQNQINRGFAAGNNLGLKIAQGKYILLLNSDTKIIDDALDHMINFLDRHPHIGALTPKVMLPDGAVDLACHRGLPTIWNSFTYFAKLEQLFPSIALFAGYHQTHLDFDKPHRIEATAATAMMVRRSVIEKVGKFDERFFLYAEDLDWCKRINDAGYEIYYYPRSVVMHFKSQSGKRRQNDSHEDQQIKRESLHHFYDTMKQYFDKHYGHKYPKPVQYLIHKAIDTKKWWDSR